MADLRQAIEDGALDVWYQPIVSLESAEAHAVEALVRWDHPERGMLTAGAFVPLAEQTGMIKALNRLVLEKALAQQSLWQASGLDVDVTVNLTMIDLLDTSLPGAVSAALDRGGRPDGSRARDHRDHCDDRLGSRPRDPRAPPGHGRPAGDRRLRNRATRALPTSRTFPCRS